VSLFRDAQASVWVAGECLGAYRRGEEGREATVGALLEAEHYAMIRGFFMGGR
jgi:hypothetical protein